jgi:CubicO group peptidase (beta-lactamase class C family)
MHRSAIGLTAAILLLLVRAPLDAQELRLNWFRDYLQSLRLQAGIPGLAAAIVERDDVLWEEAFGYQDLEQLIATRTDTPFHFDGVTQVLTATLLLRCAEEGRLSLDARVAEFAADAPEPEATLRELLTHTSRADTGLVFAYQPERLEMLSAAVQRCTGSPFRQALAGLLDRLAMRDSVPGPDVVGLLPTLSPPGGFPTPADLERYGRVLERLAVPYAVDAQRRPTRSEYAVATLTPAGGLITTVRDLAQFDLALRRGLLLHTETVLAGWQPPIGAAGQLLPHGLGWFVQTYNGERVVWQFGVGENASSSLLVSVPARGLTLVLLANSTGLVRPFALAEGDLTVSPFGRVFLSLFVR